ncbi:type II toxin-antitoxin system VapC family toxin [Pseudomonas viridiflava]|uniref:type II toxin-antitoxin system VapC family toxin n=1 Tax=Pseudomonas viridiflava TaxID=33069 RepID=UPI000F060AC4|nr:type II toxin-antitoxin system VapC family toxin [Pseudomonas viridiflava]
MSKIILLDTSFMLELFLIPLDSTRDRHEAAKALFDLAIDNSYDVYCTLGVLYETANHIVDVKHAETQRKIASKFKEMVELAWSENVPFTVIPNSGAAEVLAQFASLPEICVKYTQQLRQRLSLVDCTIVEVAEKLKSGYQERERRWPAHIWTSHAALKALEPDFFEHEFF